MDNDTLAILLVTFGTCFYSLGFIYVNQHDFHPFMTNLPRGLMNVVICAAIIKYNKMDMTFWHGQSLKWNIVRNSIMVFQGTSYAAIQFYLPLPVSMTLNSISPMIIYIYDYFLYGISINKKQLIFLLITFVGAMLTANGPYFLSLIDQNYNSNKNSSFENYQTEDPIVMLQVAFLFLLVKIIHGYGVMTTKKITKQNGFQISYIQGLLVLFSSAITLPYVTNQSDYKEVEFITVLKSCLFSGCFIALGSTFWITALTLTKNFGLITTFSFTSIILGYLVSVFRYGQQLNIICTLGSIMLIVGITFLVRFRDPIKS